MVPMLGDIPLSAVVYAMTSDASKEGARVPGMGGYFVGLGWDLPLDARLLKLNIPALELMAVGINLIVFHDIVMQLLKQPNAIVLAYIDAQASPQLLVKKGTTSWTMGRVLAAIQNLPQYKAVKGRLCVAHTYGEGNCASDYLSRGQRKEFEGLCAQMQIRQRRIQLPIAAITFVEEVLASLQG